MAGDQEELTDAEFDAQVEQLSEELLAAAHGRQFDVAVNALAKVLAAVCATSDDTSDTFAAATLIFVETYGQMRDEPPDNDDEPPASQPEQKN